MHKTQYPLLCCRFHVDAQVPRMKQKVQCFLLVLSLHETARLLEARMEALTRACRDVMESERLIRIMEVVRAIGNFMNTYSGTGAAVVEGFTVDSLLQVGCLCVHDVSVAKP
jgi:uncharacterized protein with PhoU and TrkA domain